MHSLILSLDDDAEKIVNPRGLFDLDLNDVVIREDDLQISPFLDKASSELNIAMLIFWMLL